jgi:uncharacterized protein YgiM (DUF1202 family)
MRFCRNLILTAVIVFIASVSFAEERATVRTNTVTEPQVVSYPHIAEVTGNNIYVRSGWGKAYYFCTKLTSPARVTVLGSKYGYSEILPPAGSYSWISSSYVKLDRENPMIGTVTGDAVRVYAGANHIAPENSTSPQRIKLNKGDVVRIAGKSIGDYYKIKPPVGSSLWISSQYLKYISPVPQPKLVLPGIPQPRLPQTPAAPTSVVRPVRPVIPDAAGPGESMVPVVKPIVKPAPKVEPVKVKPAPPKEIPQEIKSLIAYRKLADKLEAENAKPMEKQNYMMIKKGLQEIAKDEKAGKAKRYADYQLGRIERFELALQVSKILNSQDKELAKARQQIRDKYKAMIESIPDVGKYIVTGTIKPSYVYTSAGNQKRYIVVNKAGKIVCYAVPARNAVGINVDKFIGSTVGLEGQVASDTKSPMSLVKFTSITRLD